MDASVCTRRNDRIVGMLEAGVVPWRRPWSSVGLPRNLVSREARPGHQTCDVKSPE